MSYGFGDFGSRNCMPSFLCGPPPYQMQYNPYQCCPSPCPSYMNQCISEPSCNPLSKLASFAHYGGEMYNRNACCDNPPRQSQQQCQPQRPACNNNVSSRREGLARVNKYLPPALIDNGPRQGNRKTPAERLRNVDVLEELCYYVPGQDPCCPPLECYNVCNCCGASEQVDCGCPGRENPPPNPVKYSRRQRFTFQGQEVRRNEFNNGPQWPFDRSCAIVEPRPSPSNNRTCSTSNDGPRTPCGKILPPETGIYYFNSKQKSFIPQKYMPKAPEVIYQPPSAGKYHQQHQPQIEEYEILEEDTAGDCGEPEVVVQPVIQPIFMPNNNNNHNNSPNNQGNQNNNNNGQQSNQNSCNNNTCNPCCNPCFNPCNPMGNMCSQMGPCGPCIPMCIPMCPPQAPPPPPPPVYPPPPQYAPPPPMYGGPQQMFPPMFPPQFFPPGKKEKKHKKEKKSKKKKKKPKETIVVDFEEEEDESPSPVPSPVVVKKKIPPKAPSNKPPSTFSENIIVPGVPAQVYSPEFTPQGLYSETLNSEYAVPESRETTIGDDGAIITTITFPPGEAQNVLVAGSPSQSILESNIDVFANIGDQPVLGGNSSQKGTPNSSTLARNALSPTGHDFTGDGTEVTTYLIPQGQDATIVASNEKLASPKSQFPSPQANGGEATPKLMSMASSNQKSYDFRDDVSVFSTTERPPPPPM